jgi:hypothetical protein
VFRRLTGAALAEFIGGLQLRSDVRIFRKRLSPHSRCRLVSSIDPKAVNRFSWDVYHIENYLLEKQFLVEVLRSLGLDGFTEQNIFDRLGSAAREVVPVMLIHKMRQFVNSSLIGSIDLGFAPNTLTIGRDLHAAASRSVTRINNALSDRLAEDKLLDPEQKFRLEIEQTFADGTWATKPLGGMF